MTNRITNTITTIVLVSIVALLGALGGLGATPAQALGGAGHGPGYLSASGWWLGTYRLDDGAQGFCLNAGKPSPPGHTLDYRDGEALGWFTPEQSARLAYISRSWAGTGDRLTAAAGQLATWMVAGLGGHTPEELAARAGAEAGAVLARAREMAAESERLASTGVRADAVVELAGSGPGRLRVELTVDRLGGQDRLPSGAHHARVALDGAVFADGSASAEIVTGEDVPIAATGTESTVSVAADVELDGLPYGSRLTVAVPRDDAQAVLVAVPASASALATAKATGPSPLPFQPVVSTVTGAATAAPGDTLSDRLTVDVETADGLLPAWGVRASDEGFEPIAATVESTLLGPFTDPIHPAPTAPANAPVVCTVETAVTGPGEYETPGCTLPAVGYYVWVERIDDARVPADQGGDRIRPWRSSFGIASEVTHVPAPAVTEQRLPAALAATGSTAGPLLATVALSLAAAGYGAVATAAMLRRRARCRS